MSFKVIYTVSKYSKIYQHCRLSAMMDEDKKKNNADTFWHYIPADAKMEGL